jgi:hypothetical protein
MNVTLGWPEGQKAPLTCPHFRMFRDGQCWIWQLCTSYIAVGAYVVRTFQMMPDKPRQFSSFFFGGTESAAAVPRHRMREQNKQRAAS